MYRVFSAPGKAFLAGGYLVLEPCYDSYITALSARTHCVVTANSNSLADNSDNKSIITILSPQFKNAVWKYYVDGNNVTEANGRKNPFLEATVEILFRYLPSQNKNITLTIFSDPGFHTQDSTVAKVSLKSKKRFLYHNDEIANIAKTGLGSSASLVTVVVMAIVSQYYHQPIHELLNLVHNLAQISHCKAQGKIGSGFDVATAVYGSIRYRRFQPHLISDYIGEFSNHQKFVELINSSWDFIHSPCSLPPGIKLLMGDIKGGSETPKLVSVVLKWRNLHPQSEIYTDLNHANLKLMDSLLNLHTLYNTNKEEYLHAIDFFASHSVATLTNQAPEYRQFYNLIDSIKIIRSNLKKLTLATTADIEPDSQTQLLDNCNSLNGVLGGVVPGAGGYDAICLLVIESVIDSIITDTKANSLFSQVEWLDLDEESNGLVENDINDYLDFLDS